MASSAQTVTVKVELDAEAFQDAVQHAVDAAANAAHPFPLEHVRPEEVREGDVLLVPVRVTSIRPPHADGAKDRPHIHARPVPGPWGTNARGQLWTHGWTSPFLVDPDTSNMGRLIRKVQP